MRSRAFGKPCVVLLMAAPLVLALAEPVSASVDGRCPIGMKFVQGDHYDEVEHLCIDFRKAENRCFAYYEHFTVARGPITHISVCIDEFEAPNERGKKPIVMVSYLDAEEHCKKQGKRLCTEAEWETACEQRDFRPWQYGWRVNKTICNSNKLWKPFDAKALVAGGETTRKEVARLWQGSPSGAFEFCRTEDGVYDMMGNVEEWVTSSRAHHKHKGVLMGGFWAKPWTGCRGTNDAHDTTFAFYEVGFRCCADPKPP